MIIAIDRDNSLMDTNSCLDRYRFNSFGNKEPGDLRGLLYGVKARDIHRAVIDLCRSTDIPPVEGAIEGIRELKRMNHQIHLVSVAPGILVKGQTIEWMKKQGILGCIENVEFGRVIRIGEQARHKRLYYDNNDVGVYLDDCAKAMDECRGDGRKGYLLNQSWNQGVQLPDECQRVMSWGEFVDKIRMLEH